MPESWFQDDLNQLLLERRSAPASVVMQLFNFLGDLEGYVLVVAFLYVAWDKKLAFRLALVAIGAMLLNHGLKTLIANPRPFVEAGTWAEKWAVSSDKAAALVSEYSTPSGHAMTGSAFYTFLIVNLRRPWVRGVAVVCILLTGLARPYIGVHYVGDVLLGWAIGIPAGLLAARFGDRIAGWWNALSAALHVTFVVGASLTIWVGTVVLYAGNPHGPPPAVLSYLGLLAGLVLGAPIEARRIGFDPRSSAWPVRLLRFVLAVALIAGTLVLLDAVFTLLADDRTGFGQLLRYLRYAAAGFAGVLLAPYLFVRAGLATPSAPPYHAARSTPPRRES